MNPIAVFFLGLITLLFIAAVVGPRIEERMTQKDE